MKSLMPSAGWLLFLVAIGIFGRSYGRHWTFGRYAMPHSLMAANGLSYRDGMPVDPVTLALAQADIEEETELAGVAMFVVLAMWLGWESRKLAQMKKRLRELEEQA